MTIALADHLTGVDRHAAMAADVRAGLTAEQKSLPPKYFYDQRGSELFDDITRLPEYYPTRTERAILLEWADTIAARTGAVTLNELGSGTSEKTRLLLDALRNAGTLRRFVPFDVDPSVLEQAATAIVQTYPGIEVHGVVGDFERHLDRLPREERRLVVFLGSTIGNLTPSMRASFFADLRATMRDGDAFLLGTDLVKDTGRLVAAYDDRQGVTAEFNKNVLRVLNRELRADFDVDAFDHVALWNPEEEWIEMRLRSARDQIVTVGDLDLTVSFGEGEEILTEISAKFRREKIEAELSAAGLALTEWWTDPQGDFALSLSIPA